MTNNDDILSLIRDAFNDGMCEGMREHTSRNGGKTWVDRRPVYERKLAALRAQPAEAGAIVAPPRPRKSLNDPVVDDRNSDEAGEFVADFIAKQEPLGAEFEKILHDNMSDFYIRDDAATPAKPVSGEVLDLVIAKAEEEYPFVTIERHAFIAGAEWVLALPHFTAQSEALAEARESLQTILANTEADAIPHIGHHGLTAYEALAKDIADCARAAIAKIDAARASQEPSS